MGYLLGRLGDDVFCIMLVRGERGERGSWQRSDDEPNLLLRPSCNLIRGGSLIKKIDGLILSLSVLQLSPRKSLRYAFRLCLAVADVNVTVPMNSNPKA